MTCCASTSGAPDITINKNVDYIAAVEVYNPDGSSMDLTGYTAQSQIRSKKGGALLAEFAATVVDPTGGIIQLFLAQAICETLEFTGNAVYDLIVEDGSGLKYWITGGKVYLDIGVTR